MSTQNCNLCGESINKPGMGGTTVGVSLETNQITVSHTRCRDMHTNQAKSIQVPTDVHRKLSRCERVGGCFGGDCCLA